MYTFESKTHMSTLEQVTESAYQFERLRELASDAVLIGLLPPVTQSPGGLWIPESANQNKQGFEGAMAGSLRQGCVIRTGPGAIDANGVKHPLEVKARDRVSFYYMAELEALRWPDDRFMVVPERFIQCVMRDSGEIVPLHDRVILERIQSSIIRFKGSFMIPEESVQKPLECRVLSVGSGLRTDRGFILPLEVEVGQRVLIGKYSGTDMVLGNRPITVCKEEEIIGVLED